MKELKQQLSRLRFCQKQKKRTNLSEKKNQTKQQNPNPKKLCFQAFYWATGKIVQINAPGTYDTIAFLSSL